MINMFKQWPRFSVIALFLSGSIFFSGRSVNAQTSVYSPWSNGPSTSPSYFPLTVWLQSPPNIGEYQNIGINMFLGFWGSLDVGSMTTFGSMKMPVVPTQNSVGLTSPQRSWIWGWDQMDEPDNAQSNGSGGYGPCITPASLISTYSGLKANDTTSPVFLNFGQGVANTSYSGRGSCTGDTAYYVQASAAGDVISYDVYPVANYNGQLEIVATGLDNLKAWTTQCNCGKKIIWNFIETTPFNGGATPTPSQIQSEVWMSLIHGSQGIIYFMHVLSPTFREDGIFNYPASVAAVKSIDAQITSLAPALNSATITNDASVSSSASGVPIDMMEKNYGGSTYIFSVARANGSTVGSFTVPGGANASVTVLGESRQIAMSNGQFQDNFAAYGVHLYQLSSGTSATPAPPTNLRAVAQ